MIFANEDLNFFFFFGRGLEISFPINLDKVVPIVIYSTYIIVFEKKKLYLEI